MILLVLARESRKQSLPVKVSDNTLKQATGACDPLFAVPTPSRARRSRLRLKQASPERGLAHSAFVKGVLEAAFQMYAALAQKRLARLALDGTGGAIKGL